MNENPNYLLDLIHRLLIVGFIMVVAYVFIEPVRCAVHACYTGGLLP